MMTSLVSGRVRRESQAALHSLTNWFRLGSCSEVRKHIPEVYYPPVSRRPPSQLSSSRVQAFCPKIPTCLQVTFQACAAPPHSSLPTCSNLLVSGIRCWPLLTVVGISGLCMNGVHMPHILDPPSDHLLAVIQHPRLTFLRVYCWKSQISIMLPQLDAYT